MQKDWYRVLVVISFVILIPSTTFASTAMKSPGKSSTPAASNASVEETWDDAVVAAKKEGVVRIYASWTPPVRDALTKAFSERYGITLEFVFGRGGELMPKMLTERQAGLNLVDVIGTGTNSFLTGMKPAGLLGKIEPLITLPEVTDPKAWSGGRIPYADKDHTVIPITASAQRYFIYNKNLIRAGELKTYQDALNPKYKGKVTIGDPTIPGAGNGFFSRLAHNWLGLDETKGFLQKLLTEQRAVVARDYRIQVEEIAKGKYAIGLGTQGLNLAQFLTLGAPIVSVPLRDVDVTHESGTIAVPKVIPHPHGAKVFVNWLLTAEGSTVFSRSSGMPVLRLGVSTAGIDPLFIPGPDDKLYVDTEEFIMVKGDLMKIFKQIIDTYSK